MRRGWDNGSQELSFMWDHFEKPISPVEKANP